MIKCKIALIAFSRDSTQDCFLNLGEVYDKTVREDIDMLVELHKNLRYMCPFKAKIKDGTVKPDNLEEICCLQDKYKLTRKIISHGTTNGTMRFETPELYDASCMVPLFANEAPRRLIPIGGKIPARMFIIYPYFDPVVRGEVIDSCIDICDDRQTYFYTFGKVQGCNTRPSCVLTKRYLLSCGIPNKNILHEQNDEFPDCIAAGLNMIEFILPDTRMDIWIAVARQDMNKVLGHIRFLNAENMKHQKIYLLCN